MKVLNERELIDVITSGTDPYKKFSGSKSEISKAMFEVLPLDPVTLKKDITRSYQELLRTQVAGKPLSSFVNSNKIIALLFHEMVVEAVSQQKAYQAGVSEQADKDIVCLSNDFFSLEVKGSQKKNTVSANKSYVLENGLEGEGKKSKNSFYLVLNHNPEKGAIERIGFAYFTPDDWQTTGADGEVLKGQIVPLKASSQKKIYCL